MACAILLLTVSLVGPAAADVAACQRMFRDEAIAYTERNVPQARLRGGTVESHVCWWLNTDDAKRRLKWTIDQNRKGCRSA